MKSDQGARSALDSQGCGSIEGGGRVRAVRGRVLARLSVPEQWHDRGTDKIRFEYRVGQGGRIKYLQALQSRPLWRSKRIDRMDILFVSHWIFVGSPIRCSCWSHRPRKRNQTRTTNVLLKSNRSFVVSQSPPIPESGQVTPRTIKDSTGCHEQMSNTISVERTSSPIFFITS